MYHFTNYAYAAEARLRFNPEHPTSLLYEKHADGYKLIGVMYTAPKRFTEEQLDDRIPLSVAQWHEHVNFCTAPASMTPAQKKDAYLGHNAQFGLRGSITTRRRHVPPSRIQLDGPRLSLRKRSSKDLVSRAPTR
jgi:hypothetical protein